MSGRITFTMIKPNSVKNNHIGPILKMINEAGFFIRAMKMKKLSREEAEEFYAVHKGKHFFEEHIEFMTSAPVVAILLEKDNAVEDYRTLIGSTHPDKAAEGTIRKLYADGLTENSVHGADSDENALVEASFFFSGCEQYFNY